MGKRHKLSRGKRKIQAVSQRKCKEGTDLRSYSLIGSYLRDHPPIPTYSPSSLQTAEKNIAPPPPPHHTGQVGDHTTCSQNKHVGEFLYFKLPKLPVQVKSRAIKDVTKYVLNTDVQFKK